MRAFLAVVAAVVALLSSSSEGATLADYITRGPMRDLLNAANLMDKLRTDGPYTLFIPSDLYLNRYLQSEGLTVDQLSKDQAVLQDFLLYHIVNGTVKLDQASFYNERHLTTLNGQTIRLNNYSDKRFTAQGVGLQSRGHYADNGVIHYLYGPMLPANGTVADVVASQSDLSTLLTAVQAAGIQEFLIDQDPITLFAPTNAAFAALGSKVTTLLENPPLLADILKYHVVPGTLYTAGIHTADLHTFEEADRIHVQNSFFGSFTVEGGHLSRSGDDMSATNGVVHKIDKVLIPDSLKNQI